MEFERNVLGPPAKKFRNSTQNVSSRLIKQHSTWPGGLSETKAKNCGFLSEHSQQLCWNTMPVFGKKVWGYLFLFFLVKKIISFCCSIKHFWDHRRNTFCIAFKTSFYVSESNSRPLFSKKVNSNVFFRTFCQRITASVGKLQDVLKKMLVALSEDFLQITFFFCKIKFLCFLKFQERKRFGSLK